jgi:LacI family transcriptional regulator
MGSRPPTLRDVAEKANVHTSTVSRALNDRTRGMINPITVERVRAAAEALGYQPNSLARGLKTRRTLTVGMVIPDLTNPLFPPIVRGIEDRFRASDYTLFLANTDQDPDRERQIIGVMQARHVDGIIVATARRTHPLLEELQRAGVPLVLVNRVADLPMVSSVTADDHDGVGQAMRHLIALGHRRIAHIAGSATTTTGVDRATAYRYWLEQADIAYDEKLVTIADWFTEADGAEACQELLDRGVDATAILAANDLVALGCYQVLRSVGLRVPEDVSVVGYNDIPFTHAFAPPLTSVRVPLYELGQRTADLLLEHIGDDAPVHTSVRLMPRLVVRGSTVAPATSGATWDGADEGSTPA